MQFCPPPHDTNVSHKTVINFSLPFTGSHSLQIQTQIIKLCSSAFPDLSLHFIFQSGWRLSSLFPFKDHIPMLMRLHVVYNYTCRCCSASYLGQTCRHLHTRILEHVGVLPLTGKKQAIHSLLSILSHTCQTRHSISLPTSSGKPTYF